MASESMIVPRGAAKFAITLLFLSTLLCLRATGQSAPPLVTSSVSSGLTHPSSPAWGHIYNTAITTGGDWLVLDGGQGALYEFPADGSPMITLLQAGSMSSDPGLAVDSMNTLYLEGNWSNCILRFPYDTATKTWDGLAAITPSNGTSGCNGAFVQYNLGWPDGEWGIQPKGLTTDINNNVFVGSWNDAFVAEIPVIGSGATATPGTPIVLMHSAKTDIVSVAVDKWENVYFVEDASQTGALPGVYEIPAGSKDISGDGGLTRVDPMLPDVTGVSVDSSGNLYISDGSIGVVMVPAAGAATATPQTSNAVLLSPNAAQGSASIDWNRQILYVPTTTTQSNGLADIAQVTVGAVGLGSSNVGTVTYSAPVTYAFTGSATPGSLVIQEDGAATPDFATATGGTCNTGTAYTEGQSCTVNVVENPLSVGAVSAKLVMLDSSNNVLASTVLNGTGIGSALSVSPALEAAVGTGLKTPSQVAVDAAGNSYVADAGLAEVLMYPPGASTGTAGVAVGTGLKAPTGVAVDGAGDVLIADSGSVIEVPYTQSGLNAAGEVTLKSGLGTNLRLAVDGLDNLYVADPDDAQVVKLGLVGGTAGGMLSPEIDITGFTAPSEVAVDSSNNLYVLDNSNLIEVQEPSGTQSTVLSGLGAATGLALDATGAVYAALPGGTVRIPDVSGTLTQSSLATVATSVTNPMGLALDKKGNLYVADGTAEDLHLVSINGSLNFGLESASSSLTADLLNIGNSNLSVTGFSSSDTEDFSATGCSSAVSSGASCSLSVTMNPGPGIQGPISSVIAIQGNAANSPVEVDASATGASLATSNTAISVDSSATVVSIPITVTVSPSSGTGVPTGNVVVSIDGTTATTLTLSNGTATVTLSAIAAGSHSFNAQYIGDRTYGSSSATSSAVVAKAAVVLGIPTPPAYILSTSDGDEPYDYSLEGYYTNFVVTVTGAAALPPTGLVQFMQGTSSMCNTSTLVNGIPIGTPAPGEVTFQPGCLTISTNSNSPNEVTQQTISSVVYSGDANYLPSTATTTTAGGPIAFEELRQPSVSIGPNPGALTISSGTGSIKLSVASMLGYGVSTNSAYPSSTPTLGLNNYTLPLAFACQGLPAYATCTFTGGNYTDLNGVLHPDEVVVDTDPSKPVSISVTIKTNLPTGAVTSQNVRPSSLSFAAMFGIGLFGLVFGGRKSGRKGRALFLICLLILGGALVSVTACSSSTAVVTTTTNTPTGSYAVSITAQQVGSIMIPGTNGAPVVLYGSENQMSLPYTLNVTVQ